MEFPNTSNRGEPRSALMAPTHTHPPMDLASKMPHLHSVARQLGSLYSGVLRILAQLLRVSFWPVRVPSVQVPSGSGDGESGDLSGFFIILQTDIRFLNILNARATS